MSKKYEIKDYFNRIVVFPEFAVSDDGKYIAYVGSITGSPQVWIADVPPLGLLPYPKPVTTAKEKQPYVFAEALQWLGSERLVALMDEHGNEKTFIEIIDLKTGEIESVPRARQGRDYLGFSSQDKQDLFFTSSRENPRAQGLFKYSLRSKSVELLHNPEWSCVWAGGKQIKGHYLFLTVLANNINQLHAIHPKTKKVETLFAEPDCQIFPVAALNDDQILVESDHRREFISPGILNVKTGKLEFLGRDKWDHDLKLSFDQKHLLTIVNRAGRSELKLESWPTRKIKPLHFPKNGVVEKAAFSRDNRSLFLSFISSSEPRDFFRVDLKSLKAQKLTDNFTSPVPRKTWVEPKLVKFQSEAREIYSWLHLPHAKEKVPVIVWPHGGPQWQERPSLRPVFQYFLGRGFAIWAPNPSGSTGFGKTCVNAINQQWGTADLPDMKYGLEWLCRHERIDSNRIAIMGGSYGGYMTLRSVTRFPEVFRVAVDIFGVSNLLSFAKSIPEDWRPYTDKLVGNPEKDAVRLREQSPVFELDKIRCPLLVIQGVLDPRVTKSESDQVVESLRKRGHPVEYVVYEDEGHGFLKLHNELDAYTKAAKFIEKYV